MKPELKRVYDARSVYATANNAAITAHDLEIKSALRTYYEAVKISEEMMTLAKRIYQEDVDKADRVKTVAFDAAITVYNEELR